MPRGIFSDDPGVRLTGPYLSKILTIKFFKKALLRAYFYVWASRVAELCKILTHHQNVQLLDTV